MIPRSSASWFAGMLFPEREKRKVSLAKGTWIRSIRSTFLPSDECCMCAFEADSSSDVRMPNDEAKIPYDRIVEAFDLTL